MQLDERTYHLINQYLAGELSGTVLDAFKAKMKDPEFKAQVDIQAQIVEAVQSVREEELKALLKQDTKVRYIQNQWGNSWTYASAAIVILFVSAFFIMRQFVDTDPSPIAKEDVTTENALEEPSAETQETVVDSGTLAINDKPIETVPAPPQIEIAEDDAEAVEDEVLLEEEPEITETDEVMVMNNEMEKDLKMIEIIEAPETVEIAKVPVDKNAATRASSGIPEVEEELTVKSKALVLSKNYTVLMLSPTFTENTDADDSADSAKVSSRTLKVEFWSSPINFRGYNYQSNLKLYSVQSTEVISFKELDGRLYMRINDQHYFINKNGKDNKFVAVSNETLLKVLNE